MPSTDPPHPDRQPGPDSERPPSLAVVGGCGHVGLPLGLAFARAGCKVDLIDTSADRVACVNAGRMPFDEEGAADLLEALLPTGRVRAGEDHGLLSSADAVIVTIGTPVDEYFDPSVAAFDQAVDGLLARVRPGQLLVLRSTVFPGVTDRLSRELERRGLGEVDLAYCPER